MIDPEFGSTAADETSWFQAFEPGKGTKPLKLAPIPVLMALHAEPVGLAETLTVVALVAEPELPVAVSV